MSVGERGIWPESDLADTGETSMMTLERLLKDSCKVEPVGFGEIFKV